MMTRSGQTRHWLLAARLGALGHRHTAARPLRRLTGSGCKSSRPGWLRPPRHDEVKISSALPGKFRAGQIGQIWVVGAVIEHRANGRADRRFMLWLRSRSVTYSGVSCRLTAMAVRRRELQPHAYLAAPAT